MKLIKLGTLFLIIGAASLKSATLNITDFLTSEQIQQGLETVKTQLNEFKQQHPEANVVSALKDGLASGLTTVADNIKALQNPLHIQFAAAAFGLLKNPKIALTLFISQFNRSTNPVMKAVGKFLTENRVAIEDLLVAGLPLITLFGNALLDLKTQTEAAGGITPEILEATKNKLLEALKEPGLLVQVQANLEAKSGSLLGLIENIQQLILPEESSAVQA